MAKLDEITALLTEELEGFKKAIQKMEGIAEELDSSQVRKDISTISEKVYRLKVDQGLHFQTQEIIVDRLNRKVNGAKLTPKWLLGLLWMAMACAMIVLGYAFYQISDLDTIKEEAYQKGREETIQQIIPFFDEHPEAKENYEKWRLEQMETQVQK
ncbi:DUF6730 family protein [Ulvibacterium marinum]|uniref:DUF6730 family protein n=1 Tax=Ulvibacterium marinum TaxID=2419782 RepID=UPI0024952ABE|nr:DUF6730 family protein [Ulvibacterium marinum]